MVKAVYRSFIAWIPLGIAIAGLCGLIYVAVQQDYRQSLNDPQIQIAEDIGTILDAGGDISSLIPDQHIDISQSLTPWIVVYDSTGKPYAGDGYLDGVLAQVPQGVLVGKSNSDDGTDRVTWQPLLGTREAIVAYSVGRITGGLTVVVGRNMREVENREAILEEMVGIGMIILLSVTYIAKVIADILLKKQYQLARHITM